jgi:hypothetical protein
MGHSPAVWLFTLLGSYAAEYLQCLMPISDRSIEVPREGALSFGHPDQLWLRKMRRNRRHGRGVSCRPVAQMAIQVAGCSGRVA